MKSLEIVDKKIKHEKDQLEFYLSTGIPKEKLTTFYRDIKKLETIKQDLEVLEIIKNKLVDVDIVRICVKKYEDINIALWYYNFLCFREDRCLTLEELLKLKQWLEENENDN